MDRTPHHLLVALMPLLTGISSMAAQTSESTISLPAPQTDGPVSVQRALQARRSVRSFVDEPVTLPVVSQLAWAAQGITQRSEAPPGWSWGAWQGGRRTAPSAGAMYPLELYVVCGNVRDLGPGIYRYRPKEHQLVLVKAGDHRSELSEAASGQAWLATAPCILVVGAVYSRTEAKYGPRAARYVHIEVGHAVENVCLQAVALGLGSTMVGSFQDSTVRKVLGMSEDEDALAIVPVGRAAKTE